MRFVIALVLGILAVSSPIAFGQTEDVLLEEMTWVEVRDAIEGGVDTVIITIGATEQHGPQIALASDSVQGDFIGPEIAKKIGRAVVAPNIRIGASSHHIYFPGTLSARSDVLVALLREYGHSLVWHGFRHIALIPTHGGNFETVERAARELSNFYPHINIMAFADPPSYIGALTSTSERLGIDLEVAGSHAGASETSMVLAARADLVRMDEAEIGFMGDAYGVGEKTNAEGTQNVTPNGVFGDPRAATAEAGREYLNALATVLADFVQEGREQWKVSPPTDVPYGGLPDPSGPLAEGILSRRKGDFEAASGFFDAYLKKNPDDVAARIELARTAVLEGQYNEARSIVEPLLRHPSSETRETAFHELALIAPYQGRFKDAAASLKASREVAAENGNARGEAHRLLYVGYFLSEFGDLDGAAAAYGEALQLEDEVSDLNLDLQHLTAINELKQGRLHKAGNRLRMIGDASLQEAFTGHIRRFYHLNGEILLARGRAEDALVNFPLAIQSYDHPFYRETLARAYEATGRYEEAEKELVRLIELTDARLDIPIHYVKAHYQLGKLYQQMGRDADAKAMYERFLGFWGEADTPVPEVAAARDALGQ